MAGKKQGKAHAYREKLRKMAVFAVLVAPVVAPDFEQDCLSKALLSAKSPLVDGNVR